MQSFQETDRRINIRCKHVGNQHLVIELQKLLDTSALRGAENIARNYRRAIMSIKRHETLITTREQAKTLRGIGDYISAKIEIILRKSRTKTSSSDATLRENPNIEDIDSNSISSNNDRIYMPSWNRPYTLKKQEANVARAKSVICQKNFSLIK